jgi:hypothetical protein
LFYLVKLQNKDSKINVSILWVREMSLTMYVDKVTNEWLDEEGQKGNQWMDEDCLCVSDWTWFFQPKSVVRSFW